MDCCLHTHVHEQTDIRVYTCSPRFGHRLLQRVLQLSQTRMEVSVTLPFPTLFPLQETFFNSKIKSQEKQLQNPQLIFTFKVGAVKGIIAALRMFFVKSVAPCVPSAPLWYSFGKFLS